ncbi:5'-methylthioadenosine/adenosylhomocysteine nucleosidase [Tissierella carlieri]|uniref:adenosylhomocysteine nucleosidase n=1 Tax=Tissierella carlieri TaxID=689904 RepID=A0ABT1SDG2_9FIRM|nr:5'-methylthioadenosine/adenosylhomocysteine nucleosidase [Tissierella carlieri]MCQ4924516.1 5'-methylthioadenosine/adenosylhomocysteine nucleosidase [Tissierella carlieri]
MKRIGIIGAMALEIELLKNNININTSKNIAGFDFFLGDIDNKDVIITRCGEGKVNAASCTQILIDRFGVDSIINTGIAGGLHESVKICDVVISSNVTHHDVRKAQMENCFPYRECFQADEKLIEFAVEACESHHSENWNYHIGRIVSGESFIQDIEIKKNLLRDYSPHCVEMEGSAIGHVAHINNIPFVVIRSISDNADDEATISYNAFETIAANKSAEIVLSMLQML